MEELLDGEGSRKVECEIVKLRRLGECVRAECWWGC